MEEVKHMLKYIIKLRASDYHGEKPSATDCGSAVFVGLDSYTAESVKTHGKAHT